MGVVMKDYFPNGRSRIFSNVILMILSSLKGI